MKRIKHYLLIALAFPLALALVACTSTAPAAKDGSYIGEAEGKGGKIVVQVNLARDRITGIKILEQHETEGLGDNTLVDLANQVIAANSAKVDAISGASLTSKGFLAAVEKALAKAGTSSDKLAKIKAATVADDEAAVQNYDVVVVGAGGAGMCAAIEAKNAGANVVLLEKMRFVGGNTLISGAEYAAPGNWIQKKEGIEDSADKHFEDTMKGGDYKADPALVRVLSDNALAGAEWLRDYVKVEFEDELMFFGGHSVKRSLVPRGATGSELVTKLQKKVAELKIPVKLETRATDLIVKDGAVVGVVAEKNGKKISFNAKGVVLTTGGFGSNLEMRKKYNPKMDEKILSTNSVGSTGDGITMAEKVGAQLVGMEYIQTYPICDTLSGMLLYVDDTRLMGGTIIVNKEGKRFVEELQRRDVMSDAIVRQTGSVCYEFWDEAAMKAAKIVENHGGEVQYLYKNKMMVKANTVKEAADFFGIDAVELQASIDRYNQYAKDGKDLEFNKRGTLTPFGAAPYYIVKACPAVHHTMGGVKIDPETRVVNVDGKVIPGLYAAGEVTGGIQGSNRLGSNAIPDITVFGRIAGKNAAARK
jgi:urocanate reductase